MRQWLLILVLAIKPFVVMAGTCAIPESGLAVMGYSEKQGWIVYQVDRKQRWQAKPTAVEPRLFARSVVTEQLVYIGIDGAVYLSDGNGNEEKIIAATAALAFAQPAFSPDAKVLYLTGMREGNSESTNLYQFDLTDKELTVLADKRSAQFEPYAAGEWVYYSHVSCVSGCASIIQDIWRRHVISGEVRQLTMTPGIAREPAFSEEKQVLYFSANESGHYHIWRLKKGGIVERMTTGSVTDTSPQIAGSAVFFLRQDASGQKIMCHDGEREFEITTPEEVTRVRSLRL